MMILKKKSQGISINTIIIAAIALAVLVVLFAIFTGRLGSFSKGIGETASCANSCKALGKSYYTLTEDSCKTFEEGTYIPGKYDDVPSAHVCCCKK